MNAQTQNMPAQSPAKAFQVYMNKYKSQLEMALPKHLTVDRMMRLSLTAFSQNPKLQQCSSNSIFSSIIIASQLGLEPGVNGQGYLVPYNGTCTFIPGWKGLVDLAQRGGRSSVWTGAVYEGDDFDYMLGDSPYCRHKPCGEFDVEKLTHVYAIGRVKDSEMPIIEVWPVRKVREHFKKTVVKGLQPNHYSHKHFEAYARKVALLQVLKYMPQSIELSNAMDVSNAQESGKGVTIDGDFVNVDNTQQHEEQPQNDQNSASNVAQIQDVQEGQEQQEDVYFPPTFAQIKHGILSAKSPAHLDVMEEQAMDHGEKEERKQLMALVKAQSQKFQPAATGVTTAKKPEPRLEASDPATAVEEKPKAEPKKVRTPTVKKEVVESNAKYQALLNDLLANIKNANTPAEVNAQIRYADHNKWTDEQRVPLENAIQKRIAELSTDQPAVEQKPLLEQIQEAASIEVLDELLKQARRFTGEKGHALMTAWAARKEFLNQGDIFENLDTEQHEDNLTLCGQIVKSIQACQTQEEINKIFEDPKLSELIPEEQALVNAAADRREAEITG